MHWVSHQMLQNGRNLRFLLANRSTAVRVINKSRLFDSRMPTECITNPLQRELADSIIRMVPLDEIRILLACGAKVSCFSNSETSLRREDCR